MEELAKNVWVQAGFIGAFIGFLVLALWIIWGQLIKANEALITMGNKWIEASETRSMSAVEAIRANSASSLQLADKVGDFEKELVEFRHKLDMLGGTK